MSEFSFSEQSEDIGKDNSSIGGTRSWPAKKPSNKEGTSRQFRYAEHVHQVCSGMEMPL